MSRNYFTTQVSEIPHIYLPVITSADFLARAGPLLIILLDNTTALSICLYSYSLSLDLSFGNVKLDFRNDRSPLNAMFC